MRRMKIEEERLATHLKKLEAEDVIEKGNPAEPVDSTLNIAISKKKASESKRQADRLHTDNGAHFNGKDSHLLQQHPRSLGVTHGTNKSAKDPKATGLVEASTVNPSHTQHRGRCSESKDKGAGLSGNVIRDQGAGLDGNMTKDELAGLDGNMTEDELAGPDQNKIEDELAGPDGNITKDELAGPDLNVIKDEQEGPD